MRRQVGQLSLADGLVAGRPGSLDKVLLLVDWSAFERLMVDIHGAPAGRPGYGPMVLFRCLLLQQWYGLSDPGLEEALADRLSFRHFVGLSLADRVPDHSTLSRFRTSLTSRGLADALLAELNRQLADKGLILRQGTLVDATLVAADARRRPRRGEPVSARSDTDATWNAMPDDGPLFGYKAHLAVDQGSGLVRQAVLTPANVSDRTPAPALIQGDEAIFYADTGYDGWWLRDRLAERGVADGVMRADYRRRRLTPAEIARDRARG
ncbi:MAG TPA: IS5 family transposase, partial [Kaistia sp.]|nr:IS5 family transposase [Kaistia sp.]